MAFVVRRPRNRWEIRESFATPAGPRARTLASFTTLTPDVIERAIAADPRLAPQDVVNSARRAGAPIRWSEAEALAASLIRGITRGETIRPGLARLLRDQLGEASTVPVEDSLVQWIGASPEERAAALVDLMGLADRLPKPRRGPLRFSRSVAFDAPRMKTIALADKVVRLHRALDRARIPHAFGGALALAYYATPRATVDIDVNVFVHPDACDSVAAVLRRLGASTIPPHTVAARDGQMRAWWQDNPIDVFFSYDEIHNAMRTAARTVPFGKTTIPILAPEHLIVAKTVFNRAKDWLDIEQMLVALDDLDTNEVTKWLEHLIGSNDERTRRLVALAAQLRGTT